VIGYHIAATDGDLGHVEDFLVDESTWAIRYREQWSQAERRLSMLLLIIVLLLLFGGGGGYYGYSRWGTGGGLGVVGTVLLIVVVLYLLGALR
jgi:hypothetical protein